MEAPDQISLYKKEKGMFELRQKYMVKNMR